MDEPIGFDSYNLCLTERVFRTISATRSDAEHLPCVLIEVKRNDIPKNQRNA